MKKSMILALILIQLIFFAFLPFWLELTRYLHPVVIVVVWICYSILTLFLISLITRQTIRLPRKFLHISIIGYALLLLILLFFRPNERAFLSINLMPFRTIWFYLTFDGNALVAFYNLAANIGLFIPFGVYYRYITKNAKLVSLAIIVAAVICIVEITQLATGRGSLDIDDLILNVLGAVIGFGLFPLSKKVFKV
ncbi:VanZ family protein [Thalassobacillus hwangdonensis]|uniref:VanZ family protein n=1 Tax=Thalassobacillus hwangdonensis TaxID=546108 RepID=A0ABW3L5V1_9BACI